MTQLPLKISKEGEEETDEVTARLDDAKEISVNVIHLSLPGLTGT